MALAVEKVSADVFCHIGTHCDVPIHFGPTSGGKPACTIDELPLDEFYGDGLILDMRHNEARSGITVEDVKKSLADMDYTIKPEDIVLIMTGFDKHIYDEKYLKDQPGMAEFSAFPIKIKGGTAGFVRVVAME